MTSISELCDELKTTDDVAPVLERMPLQLRNFFAIMSNYVSSESVHHELACKIKSATTCDAFASEDFTIVSWNINGIRSNIVDSESSTYKGAREIKTNSAMGQLISKYHPDIICLQETKINDDALQAFNQQGGKERESFKIQGYYTEWSCCAPKPKRPGYSGTSIWTKQKPLRVTKKLPGWSKHDSENCKSEDPEEAEGSEGRIITAFFKEYVIINVYVLNTDRENYIQSRRKWDEAMVRYLRVLRKEYRNVIYCGDMNVIRSLLDMYDGIMCAAKLEEAQKSGAPKGRITTLTRRIEEKIIADKIGGGACFRKSERQGIEKIISEGMIDAYRTLYPDSYGFTFWSPNPKPYRKANNGLRLDYFIVSPSMLNCLASVQVLKDLGVTSTKTPSDHAPIVLSIRGAHMGS